MKQQLLAILFSLLSSVIFCQNQEVVQESKSEVNGLNPFIDQASIFPNPSSGNFFFSAISKKAFLATMKIYDMSGKELLVMDLVNFQVGENLIPVNILNLAPGNYIVNIVTQDFSETHRVQRK